MIKQNENEPYLHFVERATQSLFDGFINYEEWSEAVLGDVPYSEETLRRISNFFEKFIQRLDREEVKTLNDEDRVEDIQKAKDELFKERCKMQDAMRNNRNELREEARFEHLCEILENKLANFKPMEIDNGWRLPEGTETKYAVLCLSDWHCGMIIDNPFNYYDVETMKDRANVIAEKAIEYCNDRSVTDLIVEINADIVDGAIHVSSRVQQEEDVIQQIIIASETLAKVINKLSPWFNSVKVYCTLGNHGRLLPNKKDCITKENFEMLIPEFLKLRLQNCDNVTVVDSKGLDFLKYNIGDKVICMAHGHNDSLSKAVEDFSKIYKQVPDEVHLAHYHGYQDINNCDVLVNVNGSLCGANDYALQIRKISKPSQNLIIYDHDRCVYSLDAEM